MEYVSCILYILYNRSLENLYFSKRGIQKRNKMIAELEVKNNDLARGAGIPEQHHANQTST